MQDTELTAADLLREAATLISEYGHAKHALQTPTGEMCALGALNRAAGGENRAAGVELVYGPYDLASPLSAAQIALVRAVRRDFGAGDVAAWNNADETTGEDVILYLKRLAEDVDEATL